jgi:hypothetical protein
LLGSLKPEKSGFLFNPPVDISKQEVIKAPDAQRCMSGSFLQERHVGELGEGGVRFASTPLRPNLSTSRLHTSRSASRFRYAQEA